MIATDAPGQSQRHGSEVIVVHVPLELRKRGGRKLVLLPETRPAQPDAALAVALARAHHWLDLVERGRYASISDLARALRVDRSYVSRHLRLTCLAPAIAERILAGEEPSGLSLRKLSPRLPRLWAEQHELLGLSTRSI